MPTIYRTHSTIFIGSIKVNDPLCNRLNFYHFDSLVIDLWTSYRFFVQPGNRDPVVYTARNDVDSTEVFSFPMVPGRFSGDFQQTIPLFIHTVYQLHIFVFRIFVIGSSRECRPNRLQFVYIYPSMHVYLCPLRDDRQARYIVKIMQYILISGKRRFNHLYFFFF